MQFLAIRKVHVAVSEIIDMLVSFQAIPSTRASTYLALDNSPCATYVEDTAGHDSVEHDIIFKPSWSHSRRPYDSPQSSFAYLPNVSCVVCGSNQRV